MFKLHNKSSHEARHQQVQQDHHNNLKFKLLKVLHDHKQLQYYLLPLLPARSSFFFDRTSLRAPRVRRSLWKSSGLKGSGWSPGPLRWLCDCRCIFHLWHIDLIHIVSIKIILVVSLRIHIIFSNLIPTGMARSSGGMAGSSSGMARSAGALARGAGALARSTGARVVVWRIHICGIRTWTTKSSDNLPATFHYFLAQGKRRKRDIEWYETSIVISKYIKKVYYILTFIVSLNVSSEIIDWGGVPECVCAIGNSPVELPTLEINNICQLPCNNITGAMEIIMNLPLYPKLVRTLYDSLASSSQSDCTHSRSYPHDSELTYLYRSTVASNVNEILYHHHTSSNTPGLSRRWITPCLSPSCFPYQPTYPHTLDAWLSNQQYGYMSAC